MNLEDLQKPLPIESIDFRVQSVNKGGYATILAYKDARVDMNRLNEVCGVLGWQRRHTRENKNCIISIWDKENKQWVSKEDTGSESNAEAQKGLASDSFKRACFNLGIGIELYDYPIISIKLKANEFDKAKGKATWDFKLKEWVWSSEFVDGKLTKLSAVDNNRELRYSYDVNNIAKKQPVKPAATNKPTKPKVKPKLIKDSKEWNGALAKKSTLDKLKDWFEISEEDGVVYGELLKK